MLSTMGGSEKRYIEGSTLLHTMKRSCSPKAQKPPTLLEINSVTITFPKSFLKVTPSEFSKYYKEDRKNVSSGVRGE